MTLYTDIDEYCCKWLEKLVAAGQLPTGSVLQKDIKELTENDLRDYQQIHFFCGIGGWPYALWLADWPDGKPIWTASLPCQPFSVAGARRGENDPRHLWPDFFRLVRLGRPPIIVGEQVSGKAGYAWFDGVAADLETEGYACGAVDIPACAVGAPHIRNRLYWVANARRARLAGHMFEREGICGKPNTPSALRSNSGLLTRFCDKPTPETVHATDGLSRPVDIIRSLGNAIVPQVAATFLTTLLPDLD